VTGTVTHSTDWDVAVTTGLVRIAFGVGLLRFRSTAIRLSGGSPDDRALRALFTYFGVRDLTLGVTALVASRPGHDVRRQLAWQAAADTTDGMALASMASRGHLPRVRGLALTGLAWGTAVSDVAVGYRLRRRP
jgi:hypothetical protein